MKTVLILIFAIVFLTFTSDILAQSEISEADYNTVLAKGLESSSAKNRRILTTEMYYSGGQVVGTRKIVSEFAGPDAKRITVTEDFGNAKSNKDSVKIGEQFFCRDGKKDWKRSDKDCSKFGVLNIPDGDYEYLVEADSKDASRKIYVKRATFVDSGSAEREAVRMKFIEIKFVADDKGIVEYFETRRGGLKQSEWGSTQVTKYEYDPQDLKIADPTKENL